MYGQCQACKDVRIPLQNIDQNETVSWFKWKLEESGEIAALVDKFSDLSDTSST